MKDLSLGLCVTLGLSAACTSPAYTDTPNSTWPDAAAPSSAAPAPTDEDSSRSPVAADGGETGSASLRGDASVATDDNSSQPNEPSSGDASAPLATEIAEPDAGGGGLPPLPPPCRGLCDEGELCNVATDECVECLADSSCGDGRECRANACRDIIECQSWDTCVDGLAVCHSQLGRCVECEIDLDCPEQSSCVGRSCVAEATGCAMGADPCRSGVVLPMQRRQVLDAFGDEFCDIPGFELDIGHNNLPHKMVMRVAWSAEAFHWYAEVTDPQVVTNADIESLWNGDVVELFLAPRPPSDLQGFFSGRVDGVQVLIAPPTTAQSSARAARLFWLSDANNPGSYKQVRESMTHGFAARLTQTGYAVEARLPWSSFGKRTPTIETGLDIAFAFGFSTAQTIQGDGDSREGAVVRYASETSPSANTCSDGNQEPWCNSTTWCPVELGQRLPDTGPSDAGAN